MSRSASGPRGWGSIDARRERLQFCLFVVAWLVAAVPPAAGQQLGYVANLRAGSISVIDVATRDVRGRIPVGADPDGLALTPDQARLYVSNFASNTVSVIDTATRAVTATVPVGIGPVGLALSPIGTELYVTNKTAATVSVIDTAAGVVVATIPLAPGSGPNSVAFTIDGSLAYVTNSRASSVSIIDRGTRAVVKVLAVDRGPSRIVMNPDRPVAYVGNHNARTISLIDTATREVSGTIAVDVEVTGLAITPDRTRLYVAGGNGVRPVDLETLMPLDYVANLPNNGSSRAPSVTTDGTFVYVSSLDESTATIIDIAENRVVGAICVESGPFDILMGETPAAPALAWITRPLAGAKVHAGNRVPVNVVVNAGEGVLSSWHLRLRAPDGGERELASGTEPVDGAQVAEIDGQSLVAKGPYQVMLEVATEETQSSTQTRIVAPDPHFALLPVDSGQSPQSPPGIKFDQEGRIVAFRASVSDQVSALDVFAGGVRLYDAPGTFALSADAMTVAYLQSSLLGFVGDVVGFAPFDGIRAFSLDASGTRVAWTALTPSGDPDGFKLRDFYYDHIAGEARVLTPLFVVAANPRDAYTPIISGDGRSVVLASPFPFDGASSDPAVQWRVYVYDVDTRVLRYVAGLSSDLVFTGAYRYPTLSDDGRWVGFVSSKPNQPGISTAALLDVQTGAIESPLAPLDGFQAFDSVITPDGRGVVVSTVADLDPDVGNADGNAELFLLNRESGAFTQISETIGQAYDTYSPSVVGDGRGAAFTLFNAPLGQCPVVGPQRDEATGFYLGRVYTVPRRAGNQPPVLAPIPNLEVNVYDLVEENLAATDPDGDRIVYFLQLIDGVGLPDGAFVYDREDGTKYLNWVPAVAGTYRFRAAAFDVGGDFALQEFTVLVCDMLSPEGGCAPTPTPTSTWTFTATATATSSLTSTATRTGTATRSSTPTATATVTATPSETASSPPTLTPTLTDTPSPPPTGGGGGCQTGGASSGPAGALALLLLARTVLRQRRGRPAHPYRMLPRAASRSGYQNR